MSFLNKLANWLDQWIWIYLIIIFLPIPIWLAVQFFDKSIQFEQSRLWRQNLLQETLGQTKVNSFVFGGITPADTGDYSKS